MYVKVPSSTCRKYEYKVLTLKWLSYAGSLALATITIWLMVVALTNWLVGAGLLAIAVIAAVALGSYLYWRRQYSNIYEKLLKRDKCTDADEMLQEAARTLTKELKMNVRVFRCPPSFFSIVKYGIKRFPESELAEAINAPGYAVVAVREVLQDDVKFWFNMWHEAAHIKQKDAVFGVVLLSVIHFTRLACCLLLGFGLSSWLGPGAFVPLALAAAVTALQLYEERKRVIYKTDEAYLIYLVHVFVPLSLAGAALFNALFLHEMALDKALLLLCGVVAYIAMLILLGCHMKYEGIYPDVFAAQKVGLDVLKPYITGEREFYKNLEHLRPCLEEALSHWNFDIFLKE